MARIYTVSQSVSVSAAQDLFQITVASTKLAILHAAEVSQSASPISQQLRITIQRATAAGTTVNTYTPRPLNPADTAFAGTVFGNNTVRATTLTLLYSIGFNSLMGWQFFPAPDDRIIIPPSAILILGLETAPSPSLTLETTLTLEELG